MMIVKEYVNKIIEDVRVRNFVDRIRKFVDRVKCWLKILTTPDTWALNYEINDYTDFILNYIMERNADIVYFDGYWVRFDGCRVKVWIRNYPYASYSVKILEGGEVVTRELEIDGLPSRCTIFRFKKFLDEKLVKYFTQKYLTK